MNARYALAVLAVRALRHAVVSAFVGALLKQLAVVVSAPVRTRARKRQATTFPELKGV